MIVFGITDKILTYVLGAAVIGLGLALGTALWSKKSLEASSSKEISRLTTALNEQTTNALKATNRNRELEGRLTAQALENQNALTKSQADNDRVAAAARAADADNGRLRRTLAAYATGSGGTTPDTADAIRARTTVALDLLAASMQLQVECAANAVRDAADYRALYNDAISIRSTMKEAQREAKSP